MKKFIISLIALLAIIVSSSMTVRYIHSSSSKIVGSIEYTSSLINNGKWIEAKSAIDDIDSKWDDTEKSWALLTDHIEIDNIEVSMLKSKEYIRTKNLPLSLSELENLKFMIEHIYEKEKFNLKNIF
jgi:hypothetical protein